MRGFATSAVALAIGLLPALASYARAQDGDIVPVQSPRDGAPIRLGLPDWNPDIPDPPPPDPLADLTFGGPRGLWAHDYRGVYAVAIHHALGGFRRLVGNETARNGLDSPMDWAAHQTELSYLYADHEAGGRWWERTWSESLVPEKGGVPRGTTVVASGVDAEVLNIGGLVLTTDGRIRLEGFAIRIQDFRTYLFRRSAETPQGRNVEVQPVVLEFGNHDEPAAADVREMVDVAPELDMRRHAPRPTPRGNIWTGDGWNADLRPSVRFRIPRGGAPTDFVAMAEADVCVRVFHGAAKRQILTLVANVRAEPQPTGPPSVSASFEIQVYAW